MCNRITVTATLASLGGRGTSRADSALIRPFDKLRNNSVRQEPVTYLFLQAGDASFVIGALVRTNGRRICFFPGLLDRVVPLQSRSGNITGLSVHHLSVEPNLSNWHLTTDDDQHRTVGPTRLIEADLNHVFSMMVRDLNALEPTPETVTMQVDTTERDSGRRRERFDTAISASGAHRQITVHNPGSGFLNLNFYLDNRAARNDESYNRLPSDSSDAHTFGPRNGHVQATLDDFSLPELNGHIVIQAAWLPGSMNVPAVFWSS